MSGEAALYLGLCVTAVVFAVHAPKGDRLAATTLACGLLGNWLFVAWTYAGASPQAWLRAQGLPFHAPDLWAIADLCLGVLAVRVGLHRWWGWAVFSLCMLHLCMHPARPLLGDALYTFWLDKVLLAQIAVFILIGGRGIADRLSFRLGLFRLGSLVKGIFAKVVRS